MRAREEWAGRRQESGCRKPRRQAGGRATLPYGRAAEPLRFGAAAADGPFEPDDDEPHAPFPPSLDADSRRSPGRTPRLGDDARNGSRRVGRADAPSLHSTGHAHCPVRDSSDTADQAPNLENASRNPARQAQNPIARAFCSINRARSSVCRAFCSACRVLSSGIRARSSMARAICSIGRARSSDASASDFVYAAWSGAGAAESRGNRSSCKPPQAPNRRVGP